MYHDASRQLQDRFDTRRLADRLAERLSRTAFTDDDTAFIAGQAMFFFATADADGWPECSYKGGVPGFVRVIDDETLAFPDYDGNGMFRSLGNILVNAQVALLFIDFEHPNRLRIQGKAAVGDDLAVRVTVDRIWPNCPRYIHTMTLDSLSPHAPREGHEPPDAEWKQFFTDVLPGT